MDAESFFAILYSQFVFSQRGIMNKIKHTAEFKIAQPVAKLFPLFSAEGEKLWVPGWDYENILGTTDLSEDYVFLTKTHDHGSTDAIWLTKRYEPETYFVQFYKVEPGDKVGIVTVQCFEEVEALTRVQVSYEYIALTEKGRKFIESFTQTMYEDFIVEWEALLVKYFESVSGFRFSAPADAIE